MDFITTSALFLSKVLSGLWIGFTLALVGQELVGYGAASFVFVYTMTFLTLFSFFRKAKLFSVLMFNGFFILLLLGLQYYVLASASG